MVLAVVDNVKVNQVSADLEVRKADTSGVVDNSYVIDLTKTNKGDITVLGQRYDELEAHVVDNSNNIQTRATIAQLDQVEASAAAARAQQASTLQAEIDQNSADITTEKTARTDAVSAETASREQLAAQIRGDYSGTNPDNLSKGLIYSVNKALVDQGESLATQISSISAGTGEQFDSAKIWHFNSGAEGWTGGVDDNGYLVPASGDSTVTSPSGVNIDGSMYTTVKVRAKRVGTPTWQGELWWKSPSDTSWQGPATLAEPAFDDGISTFNWPDVDLPDTVDQIRIRALDAQSATDSIQYDWIAIGRPAPGASTAALDRTRTALTSDINSTASDLNDLAVQMRGNYTGTNAGNVTSGLVHDLKQSQVSGDSANASSISAVQSNLANTQDDVQTNASGISALDTRVTDTEDELSSQSSSLTSLQNDLSTAQNDINNNSSNIADTQNDVTANSGALSQLDSRVSDNEDGLSSQSSSITSLQNSLDSAESDISGNSSAISGLDSRVSDNEDGLTAVTSRAEQIQAQIYQPLDQELLFQTQDSGANTLADGWKIYTETPADKSHLGYHDNGYGTTDSIGQWAMCKAFRVYGLDEIKGSVENGENTTYLVMIRFYDEDGIFLSQHIGSPSTGTISYDVTVPGKGWYYEICLVVGDDTYARGLPVWFDGYGDDQTVPVKTIQGGVIADSSTPNIEYS